MSSGEEHYSNLLAEHYSWMLGNPEQLINSHRHFFEESDILPGLSNKAIDLGCGSGIQSLALAQLGFEVIAVDTSRELLNELENSTQSSNIKTILADMLDKSLYKTSEQFQTAVCMGDSLLHLQSEEEVEQLFKNVFSLLTEKGTLVLSFRDLSHELTGTDRMIPVRLEDEKLMTTFLEYKPNYVIVHDSIFIKDNGQWNMKKSSYSKLRISSMTIVTLLEKVGFSIKRDKIIKGFQKLIARKECP